MSAGFLFESVLTQPSFPSAPTGKAARLTCTMSTGFSVGDFAVRWFKQEPGSPSQYLLLFKSDSGKHQVFRVPSQFSGPKDASANSDVLHIPGLQPEDKAAYYYDIWIGSSRICTEKVRQKPPLCSPFLVQSPLLLALTKSSSAVTRAVRSSFSTCFSLDQ